MSYYITTQYITYTNRIPYHNFLRTTALVWDRLHVNNLPILEQAYQAATQIICLIAVTFLNSLKLFLHAYAALFLLDIFSHIPKMYPENLNRYSDSKIATTKNAYKSDVFLTCTCQSEYSD